MPKSICGAMLAASRGVLPYTFDWMLLDRYSLRWYCALAEARPKVPLTLPSITRVLRVD